MMELNKEDWRELDPYKIAWTGLRHFTKTYKIKATATYKDKLERLEELINDKSALVPDDDKESMKKILKTLSEIAKCELCHEDIDWEESEERKIVNYKEKVARHASCHEKQTNK